MISTLRDKLQSFLNYDVKNTPQGNINVFKTHRIDVVAEEWTKVLELEGKLSHIVHEFRNIPTLARTLAEPIHGYDPTEEFVMNINRIFVDVLDKLSKAYQHDVLDVLNLKKIDKCSDHDVGVLLTFLNTRQYYLVANMRHGIVNVAQTLVDVCQKHERELESRFSPHRTQSRRDSSSHPHLYS